MWNQFTNIKCKFIRCRTKRSLNEFLGKRSIPRNNFSSGVISFPSFIKLECEKLRNVFLQKMNYRFVFSRYHTYLLRYIYYYLKWIITLLRSRIKHWFYKVYINVKFSIYFYEYHMLVRLVSSSFVSLIYLSIGIQWKNQWMSISFSASFIVAISFW